MSNRDIDERTVESDVDRDVDRDIDPNPEERGKWLSVGIALLGLWMVIQSWLFDMVLTQFWNDVIIGLLLVAIGGYNYYRRADEHFGSVAAAAVAALLGLWLVAAPFLLGAEGGLTDAVNPLVFWSDVIVGLLVFLLGAISAYKIRDWRQEYATTTT